MYLLNCDIAAILKQYVFEELDDFLEDKDAIISTFGAKCTKDQAKEYVKNTWICIQVVFLLFLVAVISITFLMYFHHEADHSLTACKSTYVNNLVTY